jgi:hypothetical protein
MLSQCERNVQLPVAERLDETPMGETEFPEVSLFGAVPFTRVWATRRFFRYTAVHLSSP